jgi:hypothetical protein
VMKAQISVRSAEAQQRSRLAELDEAYTQLCMELSAAHTKVVEVERHERSLTSNYDGLHRDFNDLQTLHASVVKGKANLERVEREKVQ